MPLYQTIHSNLNTQIYLWKITETEEDLLQGLELTKNATTRLDGMKSISHRKGFLAVRKILKHIGINPIHTDSIILYEPGISYYYKSTAALHIAKGLNGIFTLATVFTILPSGLRDFVYDYVAKNRYK